MRNLKIALRTLYRLRLNSAIIIISLSIGLVCMNLIGVFIFKEYNADHFQKNKNRIYALLADDPFLKGEKMYFIRDGAAEYMKANFSEVEDFCRLLDFSPIKITVGKEDFFDKPKVIAASSNFFDFFSYRLLVNSSKYILQTSQDLVISKNLANKYFGNSNPVGQRLILVNRANQKEMVISGVFEKPEESSVLNFDMVTLSEETDSRCYLKISKNTDIKNLERKFDKYKASIPIVNSGTPGTHYLKDLQSTYFDTSRQQPIDSCRSKTDLFISIIIASMVLAVALFNYLGLINNRLLEKAREHAIRQVNGSSKRNLVIDFILEIAFLLLSAHCISIFLMIWAIPYFNQLTSSSITIFYILRFSNFILLTIIPLLIFTASYIYAIYKIEKNVRIEMLKPGKFHSSEKNRIPFFNIIQLAISVILIAGSIVIMKQINFITRKDIGMNKDVLEIKIEHRDKSLTDAFKAELLKYPSIELVSVAETSPVLGHWSVLLNYDDHGSEKQYTPSIFSGDENYVKTLGIKIIEGSDFSQNGVNNKDKCIINESLAKLFRSQNLIGKDLPGEKSKTVIGIAKDFHYGSLKKYIEPGYITYENKGFYLLAKPAPGKTAEARTDISRLWKLLTPDFPLNIESIGDRYEWMHRENVNYAKIIGICCFLSVFLSMIGLFAVSYNTSRRRVKEIGIRKINGARSNEIITMLNKDFLKLVLIAFLIACPIAWLAMRKWLENFAYKTSLSWWVFAAAGVIALVIALVTVSWQSWRAATRNPVESLRYE